MCGIVGFNWEDKDLIKRMHIEIKHRGPDDYGIFCDKNISLGHRRLSIIDLSKNGHQPMFNRNGDLSITFNGEIYNYKKVRKELIDKGYSFRSETDTEVILLGYEEYGEKILEKIDGMFAFAVWDSKNSKIFLARDRVGKKPIYYYFDKGKFIFASEIKAILEYEEVEREIDEQCFSDYLTLRFSSGNRTMFKSIKKLMPANYIICQSNKIQIKKYWKLPEFEERYKPSVEKIDEIISDSVEKRLMADVPIGVFLSGGLDSSTIVSYMSKFSDKINTFSVGFGDSTDERKYAKIVAEKFSTNHKEIFLNSDFIKELPKVVWHFDEPLADPASTPTYLLSKEVSKKVKVALSGEGGDEVFGGYDSFNNIGFIKRLNSKWLKPINKTAQLMSNFSSNFLKYPRKQIMLLLSDILKEKDLYKKYEKLFYFPFDEKDKEDLLNEDILNKIKTQVYLDEALRSSKSLEKGSMLYYFNDWLPNDLLMKADKMSMAHGLEVRNPFLDVNLINYFAGIGSEYKKRRKIFRESIKNSLPKEILKRKKQGFTLPLTNLVKDKDFLDLIRNNIEGIKKIGLVKADKIDKILNNPYEFKNEHRLWVLLNFCLWKRIYIYGEDYKKIRI